MSNSSNNRSRMCSQRPYPCCYAHLKGRYSNPCLTPPPPRGKPQRTAPPPDSGIFGLLDVAAHLFASPVGTPIISYWIDIETASYGLIAVIYLLGLRQYYIPSIIFTAYNTTMYFLFGVITLPFGINPKPLTGHIEFLQYSFGRGFSVIAWLYLLVMGLWMLKNDPGSKFGALLKES